MNRVLSLPPSRLAAVLRRNKWSRPIDPITEALGFKRLTEAGWTVVRIAHATDLERRSIQRALSLLTLPPKIQQMIAELKLTARAGFGLVPYASQPAVCLTVARLSLQTGISTAKIMIPRRARRRSSK